MRANWTQKSRNAQFMSYLTYLEPQEFIGLAKIMEVGLTTDELDDKGNPQIKDAMLILADMLDKFPTLQTSVQKQILKLLAAIAFGKKEEEDGAISEVQPTESIDTQNV